jgi:hypothetical protein
LKTHVYTLKKSSVNENRTFGYKIRFLGGEKETQGVRREIFKGFGSNTNGATFHPFIILSKIT